MKYRPSPHFVAVIIILAALILTTLYLLGAIYFWQSAQADVPTVGTKDYRPDISHCFAPEADEKYDELWDCIRHEEKDSE